MIQILYIINLFNNDLVKCNKALVWTNLTIEEVVGTRQIALPATWNELHIKANINEKDILVFINIIPADITNINATYRAGYTQTSTSGGSAYFKIVNNKLYLDQAYLNTSTVTNTTKWIARYK